MQTIGQNPMAQQLMAALMAHIAEHLSFLYRKQIEDTLGVPLPAPDEPLPEDIELQLSRLVADAGKQLQQQHATAAAQQQAQQQAADPLFQLEQQKVGVQQAEVQRKTQKDAADADIAKQKLELEKMRVTATVHAAQTQQASQEKQNSERTQAQIDQAREQRRLEALKILATPKPQPAAPKAKGKKE